MLEDEVLGLQLAKIPRPEHFDRVVERAKIGWLERLDHRVVQTREQLAQTE